MRKVIRLTESDLHRIVKESVEKILEMDAWGKYPEVDQNEAMLDMNLNVYEDPSLVYSYTKLNDPNIENIHGSTLRDKLKGEMGNNITN